MAHKVFTWLTFSWSLTAKCHRIYRSLNTTFSGVCLWGKSCLHLQKLSTMLTPYCTGIVLSSTPDAIGRMPEAEVWALGKCTCVNQEDGGAELGRRGHAAPFSASC